MALKDIFDMFTSKDKENKDGAFAKLIRNAVSNMLGEAQERIQAVIRDAVRSMLFMVLTFTALIFILFGLGKYLTATVPGLAHGVGFAVVGAGILVLVLFAYLLQKE
ncbi:MAG: hypothetical protein ACLFTH_04525 [Candidatus Woesearchaeota archaeon]